MSTSAARFCPHCGASRNAGARFCGSCGVTFTDQTARVVVGAETAFLAASHSPPPPLPRAAPTVPTGSTWQVAVGSTLPDASRLFDLPPPKARRKPRHEMQDTAPSPKGKSLWGSTLWMSITQGADMMTRAMAGGGPQDAHLELRLGIAAAVAVFGITMRSMPRLRSLLVRLGAIAMALLQGQSLLPVIKESITDPSLIAAFAPNLAAQGAGLLALLRLFQTASARVK